MLQFLRLIIYPAFQYAAYAPHMSPPHNDCRALWKIFVNLGVEGILMLAEAENASVRALQPHTEGAQRSRKRCGVHYPMTVATIYVRDRPISRPAMFAASNHIQRRHGRRPVEPKNGYCGGVSHEGLWVVSSNTAVSTCTKRVCVPRNTFQHHCLAFIPVSDSSRFHKELRQLRDPGFP